MSVHPGKTIPDRRAFLPRCWLSFSVHPIIYGYMFLRAEPDLPFPALYGYVPGSLVWKYLKASSFSQCNTTSSAG